MEKNLSIDKELTRLEALCSRREYCSRDISEKLRRKGFSEGETAKILQRLIEGGFLDNRRYARAFARDKSSLQGWGARKIVFQLQSKGVPKEVIAEAMKEIDSSKAEQKMEVVLENKWRQLANEKDIQKKRDKLLRFGLGRGYEYSEINQFLNNKK